MLGPSLEVGGGVGRPEQLTYCAAYEIYQLKMHHRMLLRELIGFRLCDALGQPNLMQ